jgi:hypothetical protein
MEEYDTYFRKFHGDLFKFQTKTKKQLQCPGCSSKKRFIIDADKLTFSCGPKHSKDKKCGPQYTIELPKYINFRDLQEVYEEQVNGSFDYKNDDILEYDLQKLSLKMDVKSDLEKQVKNAKGASESLKRLIDDYIETNALNEHIETLKTLSEKRYKNSLAKKKIMRELETEELSAPEKVSLRKKYAVLIKENQGFMDMIIELRQPNTDFIMIKKPKVIKNDGKPVEPSDKTIDEPEDEPAPEQPKKLSFEDQVKILSEFYAKVDPDKTQSDIERIINNRRPKGKPKGTRIPPKQWSELCDKLSQKYTFHPLRMNEEKDKFIEEQDDGTMILVYSLSPDSPR